MRYIIAYDIEDDSIRSHVAKVLEGYGQRVQRSVFECELAENRMDALAEALKSALGQPDVGNIRIYRACADCADASFGLGEIVQTVYSQPCTII
ncbi:MAG: CRISPR-associated endonuclease Cas2 [Acidobacteria bacterium]|nr:CRISPR-associated endonuclease Cas2 [Acidobacteriota bacterium]